jgi:hypothetical protein
MKYRFLLASTLLIAFLNLLQAQDSGEMPAELDMSLDEAAGKGLGFHINGTIPLQVPDGDDTFVVNTKVRPYWRLTPVQRRCSVNEAFITVQVAGKRNYDQLTLTLSFAPEVLQLPACGNDRLAEGTHKPTVNTRNLNSREFRLFVTDGSRDEHTVKDSLNLGRLTGKLTLHLACPVKLVVGESVPEISVSPTDATPWPLLFDDSKTPAELSALAAGSSSVVGLTRPSKPYPPLAFFRPASRHATLRQGVCFWVNSIEVKFTAVQILLANKYPPGSCEYQVIREHEMLHYQDLQILFRRYQALVITALRKAGIPTMERPAFVSSVMEGTNQTKTRLQAALLPIYASMEKALKTDADARDGPEQRVLSWNKCPNWYATITRQATIP